MRANTSCVIHKESLQLEQVRIKYGLIRFSREFLDAQPKLFPNARSFLLGGCLVGPNQPKTGEVRFCPKCRDAEQLWARDHSIYAGGRT